MFMLKKIITPFLLPPGIFILACLAAAGVCLRRKRARRALFFLSAAGLLWLPALDPVADRLHDGLTREYAGLSTDVRGDVIVLLGGGIDDNARDMTGVGVPAGEMMDRIVTAVRLQRRLGVPVIASGGTVYKHRLSEAEVVRRLLVDLGVPEGQVIQEAKSRDTFENAALTRKICQRRHFRRPVLVTSDIHMKRAEATFRQAGLDVIPFPTRLPSKRPRQYEWRSFLPGSYDHTAACLKEYLGLVYYRLVYF